MRGVGIFFVRMMERRRWWEMLSKKPVMSRVRTDVTKFWFLAEKKAFPGEPFALFTQAVNGAMDSRREEFS
jgi:hypothetical protein